MTVAAVAGKKRKAEKINLGKFTGAGKLFSRLSDSEKARECVSYSYRSKFT